GREVTRGECAQQRFGKAESRESLRCHEVCLLQRHGLTAPGVHRPARYGGERVSNAIFREHGPGGPTITQSRKDERDIGCCSAKCKGERKSCQNDFAWAYPRARQATIGGSRGCSRARPSHPSRIRNVPTAPR